MSLFLVHCHAVEGGQWFICINSNFLNTVDTGSLTCLLLGIILHSINIQINALEPVTGTASLSATSWRIASDAFSQLIDEVLLKTLKDKLKFLLITLSHKFLTASPVVCLTSFLSMCSLRRQLVWVFEGPRFCLHFSSQP